jgi:hypothetical protein
MITVSSIIADIKSDLSTYAESNLIDEITIRLHLINELKRFGGNVMDVYPKVIEVKNNQARLPENFFSLYKAVKVDPIGYSCEEGGDIEEMNFGNTFFRVRKEASRTWDNLSNKFTDGEYTEVVEKIYLQQNKKADIHYGNQIPLKLKQGFDKSKLNVACENIQINTSPYEINIINNILQTNFNKGFICIWFQGLRVEEDTDDIILPEDPNARIYEFLMYSGKAKIFEMLWNNDDDPNVVQKMQYNKAEAEKARTAASTQVRFSSVTGGEWWKNIKSKQRRRLSKFDL